MGKKYIGNSRHNGVPIVWLLLNPSRRYSGHIRGVSGEGCPDCLETPVPKTAVQQKRGVDFPAWMTDWIRLEAQSCGAYRACVNWNKYDRSNNSPFYCGTNEFPFGLWSIVKCSQRSYSFQFEKNQNANFLGMENQSCATVHRPQMSNISKRPWVIPSKRHAEMTILA